MVAVALEVDAASLLQDPDAVLFRASVEIERQRTALSEGYRGARLEDPKGTVAGVRHGAVDVKLDGGGSTSVPLTARRAAQLAQLAQTGATTRK